MAAPKIIPYDVELRSVNPVRSFDRPKAYTNDLNSVEFQFKVLDMTSTELTTATAVTLVYMRDGSFFANPSTDVSRVGNVFSYLLKENEGNHAGVAQIQLVVTVDGMELASQMFDFEIINGLETKVAQEVMIYDWTTLTRDAQDYIDQFVSNEATRQQQFADAQTQRGITFGESEAGRTITFNASEAGRTMTFNASESSRTTAFNAAEEARATGYDADHSRAGTDHTTAVNDHTLAGTDHTTAANDHTLAGTDHTRAETDHTRADADSATVAGFNTRLTAEETATANNKISAVKGKTFADVDARLEDVEADTTTMGTNGVTNGDFSNGTTGWSSVGATLSVASGVGNFSATQQWGRIQQSLNGVVGNICYLAADLTGTANNYLSLFGSTSGLIYLTGTSKQRLSITGKVTSTGIAVHIGDKATSGWGTVQVDNVLLIDLTATFGAGKEPTVEQMDEIMSKFENSWFDGTKNLFRASETLKKQIAIDARTEFEAKNELVNSDFSDGTTGWTGNATAVNLIATFTALGLYGGIQKLFTGPSNLTGHKIYHSAIVNADSLNIHLVLFRLGQGTEASKFTTVTGSAQRMSNIATIANAASVGYAVGVWDSRTSGWTPQQVQKFVVIDLTATFGAGKEPTLAEMDRLMARYPNSWFDGTKPIQTIETLYQEKANKVQEAWITPTLLNGWTVASGYTVGYRKNEFGRVETKGAVTGGTIGTAPFAYLTGYRPLQSVLLSCRTATSVLANATIPTGGGLTIWDNNNTVSLDGITFPTT